MVLDDIDRALLEFLQEDGAKSCAELGVSVGLSPSSVNDRLRKLQAKGTIRRHTIDIDPADLGLDLLAFILVEVESGESAFRDAMRDCADVLECHHITGEFSYLVKLRLENVAALERFLVERLKPHPGVGRTQTLIALSSVKETHVLNVPAKLARHA